MGVYWLINGLLNICEIPKGHPSRPNACRTKHKTLWMLWEQWKRWGLRCFGESRSGYLVESQGITTWKWFTKLLKVWNMIFPRWVSSTRVIGCVPFLIPPKKWYLRLYTLRHLRPVNEYQGLNTKTVNWQKYQRSGVFWEYMCRCLHFVFQAFIWGRERERERSWHIFWSMGLTFLEIR